MTPTDAPPLNPRQQVIFDDLIDAQVDRPEYPDNIEVALRHHIETAVADDRPTDGEPLVIRKRDLEAIHACEARWAGDEWGGWQLPMLRGTVTHAAIHRLVMSKYRLVEEPGALVHDALDRLRADDSRPDVWQFLNETLTEDDLDELAAACINDVITFIADWPRLPYKWIPCMEQSRKYEQLFDGAVVLKARFDLTLGTPEGRQARKAIVDLKTGNVQADHAAEARFYALVETLRQGVPPFRIGSYYLDSGNLALEYVDEEMLFQAADLLADGIRKMVQIRAGREATATPSGFCIHCPLYLGCPTGIEHIELRDSA